MVLFPLLHGNSKWGSAVKLDPVIAKNYFLPIHWCWSTDVTVCLSTPSSLSPFHLTEAGSSWPESLPAALADAQCRSLWARRGWGHGGSEGLEQEPGHGTTGHGMLKDTLGCTPAQWLFSAHSMEHSSLFLCPAQCVRHVQLSCLWSVWICHFWATTALSSQVCHWYALSLQKTVSNRLEFKHKLVFGLVFTQKLFPLINLHR